MPPAEHNEHEAAQMFYFLLSKIPRPKFRHKLYIVFLIMVVLVIFTELQRDGIVDLHQEEFVYPQEPGDIFIRLLE